MDDDVSFGRGRRDDIGCVQISIREMDVILRVLVLDQLAARLVSNKQCVVILGVSFVKGCEDVASDVTRYTSSGPLSVHGKSR